GGGGYGGFGGGGGYGRGRFGGGYGWGATWQRDYPKADRQFLMALNRLTRINGRSYEQVVSPDSDDIYNYPLVYAVMVDDFHGTQDWEDFMRGMRQIFPDAEKYPVEDLTDKDEIFHVLYDMDD